MDDMISASFTTRRAAELAVERLVQEHHLDRNAIEVRAEGPDNTAGTRPAGADVESGHPGVQKESDPALHGRIEVRVRCSPDQRGLVEAALREAASRPPGT